MKKDKIYYTIENHNDKWTVWKNADIKNSSGCYGLFSGTLKECKEYATKNKLRIKGGRHNILIALPDWKELRKRRLKCELSYPIKIFQKAIEK